MIPFVKAHACGNDFLLIDESEAHGRHAQLAQSLCSRHFGVGADGIEFFEQCEDGSFFLRLFNADGSEAELSGNGTRCVAAWLAYDHGLKTVRLGTHGGERTCEVVECADEHFLIRTEMGVPSVGTCSVNVEGVGKVEGAVVDVGNPHFVIFTNDPDFRVAAHPWEAVGAYICTHPDFPKQTNVEFVRVLSETEIEFRIYERGVGPTQSSGTGTCASSAAAIALRGCARSLKAASIGGAQHIDWPADDAVMLLTGPAEIVCVGKATGPASDA